MSLPEDPIVPIDPPPSPTLEELAAQRARRRRATRRSSIPADLEGQSALITSLAKRAYPSIELFIFSLLSGAIISLGFLLDSQAVLLLGILLTPLMIPWVGFLISIFTGSARFFFETLMAMLISVALVFIPGLLAGFAARLFLPYTLTNVFLNARLWPASLVVLVIGAVTLVASFVRSEEKPFLPSVLVASAFFLPVNAAGFGLGTGLPGLWPDGLLIFLAHFALAGFVGLATLFIMRLRPSSSGLLFSGFILLIFTGIMIWLMGGTSSRSIREPADTATPAASNPLPSTTPSLTLTPTNSPEPPQETPTIAATKPDLTATVGAALTLAASTPIGTEESTPAGSANPPEVLFSATPEVITVVGKVSASEGGGANLRQTPNGKYIMTLDNGTLLEVLPEFRQVNGVTWIHVYVTRDGQRFEGWLLESVVIYATPAPNFAPSATSLP